MRKNQFSRSNEQSSFHLTSGLVYLEYLCKGIRGNDGGSLHFHKLWYSVYHTESSAKLACFHFRYKIEYKIVVVLQYEVILIIFHVGRRKWFMLNHYNTSFHCFSPKLANENNFSTFT